MDHRMLINAAHPEELRIGIVSEKNLVELEVESNLGRKLKGNIFKAKIVRIEPSLQAAFVDIGSQRNGFLQINDVHPSYFDAASRRDRSGSSNRPRIQDMLEAGQEIVVQVVKEERELKGATLTTFLSLPGRYVVLMPGSDRGGISRKISDSEQRKRLKTLSRELEIPSGVGMIVRTAGLDRSLSELSRDLSLQLKVWEGVVAGAQRESAPACLYQDNDVATRVIRDYFTPEIREIVIDEPTTYERVKAFVEQVMPRYRSRVKFYSSDVPLFANFNLEEQISDTLRRELKLKSGGAIVFDTSEALVAIDVNSGKATSGQNIEETAFLTNLEAAEEIARQLRLRDIGGLIVVDFIDMIDRRHRAQLERKFKEAVKLDKARIEVGRLSRFGLLELSRQRLRASLSSQSYLNCPHCQGVGNVRNPELVGLELLRKIQAAVAVGHVSLAKARMSHPAAMFILNNKREALTALQQKFKAQVIILSDGRMGLDEYELEIETFRHPAAESKLPSASGIKSAAAETAAHIAAEDDSDEPDFRDELEGEPPLPIAEEEEDENDLAEDSDDAGDTDPDDPSGVGKTVL